MNTDTGSGINTLKAHLAVNVRDVEKSIEFYRKMFGIEPAIGRMRRRRSMSPRRTMLSARSGPRPSFE